MTISFTASVLASASAPAVAVSVRHLAAFRAFARERGESLGDEGDEFLAYNFEARVCPWSLASVCAIFDHDPGVIAVVEEAQFRGLNIRFWRNETRGAVMMSVARSIDGSTCPTTTPTHCWTRSASTGTPAAKSRCRSSARFSPIPRDGVGSIPTGWDDTPTSWSGSRPSNGPKTRYTSSGDNASTLDGRVGGTSALPVSPFLCLPGFQRDQFPTPNDDGERGRPFGLSPFLLKGLQLRPSTRCMSPS